MMTYQVRVEFLGRIWETLFKAEDDLAAKVAGIRWAKNRQKHWELPSVTGIMVRPYRIMAPEADGYIPAVILPPILEWEFRTSPWTIDELEQRYNMAA